MILCLINNLRQRRPRLQTVLLQSEGQRKSPRNPVRVRADTHGLLRKVCEFRCKVCEPTRRKGPAFGNRFCGQCGARLDAGVPLPAGGAGKTLFLSGVQPSGLAKLVLVKADTGDGLAYQLSGTEHVVGRTEGAILFPDDPEDALGWVLGQA